MEQSSVNLALPLTSNVNDDVFLPIPTFPPTFNAPPIPAPPVTTRAPVVVEVEALLFINDVIPVTSKLSSILTLY